DPDRDLAGSESRRPRGARRRAARRELDRPSERVGDGDRPRDPQRVGGGRPDRRAAGGARRVDRPGDERLAGAPRRPLRARAGVEGVKPSRAGRVWLTVAGSASVAVAALHLAMIPIGEPAYVFFTAPERLVDLAHEGSPIPALVTAGLAAVFAFFGSCAFAG